MQGVEPKPSTLTRRRLFRSVAALVVGASLQLFVVPAHGTDLSHPAAPSTEKTEFKQLFDESLRLLRNNRAYEARRLLERAASLHPRDAGVHCNLGLAYQNSGNLLRAVSEFKTALSLRPGTPEATLNIAGCYQSLGQPDEAITWYDRYLKENPDREDRKQVEDLVAALRASKDKPGSDPALPDYFLSVTGEGIYKWAPDHIPIKVYLSSGLSVEGFRDSFRTLFLESLDAWVRASGNKLGYVLVPESGQADLVCAWTGNPADVSEAGTQSERGMADIYAKGNDIQRATLKILTRPIVDAGILSDADFKKACLHEVGHVLGLQGHSPNNHDVMFLTVDTSTVWPVLSKRDKATIARLYADHPSLPATPPAVPGK